MIIYDCELSMLILKPSNNFETTKKKFQVAHDIGQPLFSQHIWHDLGMRNV